MESTQTQTPAPGASNEFDNSVVQSTSPAKSAKTLPDVGTTLVIEINYSKVDAVVLSYSKGKKTVRTPPYTPATVDSVLLKLLRLPISETQTIDTETTMTIKYLKEILQKRDIKGKGRAFEFTTPPRKDKRPPGSKKALNNHQYRTGSPSTSSDSAGFASSSSSSDSDDDSDEDSDDIQGSDSEEEEFPVAPSRHNDGRRHLNKYSSYTDPLETYYAKQQQKAWEHAQASHNRDLAALRAIRINAFARAEEKKKQSQDQEVEMVRLFLQDFDLRRQKTEAEIDAAFLARNKQRWSEINEAIQKLEREDQLIAEANRKKQIEAEAIARKLREEEEKKIRIEKAAKEQQEEENKRKEEAEAKARKEKEEREKQEKEKEKAAQVTATSLKPAGSNVSSFVNIKAEFDRWANKMKEIKSTVLPAVSANPAWRSACYQLKKKLSTRISNISASASDVRQKAEEINNLLKESRATNETYLWSLNLLSKRMIGMANMNSDGDLSPVTFALAQVFVALLIAGNSELAEIFMARLVKRCPYVLPYYPMRGQLSMDDFNKLIGRKASEQTVNYNQRMSGIISLYAAIVQTSPSSVPQLSPAPVLTNVPEYFQPAGGWKWHALILRSPLPLLDITPLLLYTFLRMTGEKFFELYGKQYVKLLRAIADQAIDGGAVKWNKEVQGDLSKVRILIGDWLEKGRVQGAEGRLPS